MELHVSIVICTNGRVASLRRALESLRQLEYPHFEVCVIYGPTPDGTAELLKAWQEPIKISYCPERNLSMSRNIGIELASGDIVAFLDDDAIPEPEWLTEIVAAYANDKIGGAGGFVHDHTGSTYQYRFGTANRLADADLSWSRGAPELNFPYSENFPHLLGTNSSFRRKALLSIGGFDEEFEYYLDETDLALRLVDDGWRIIQISGAYVHHKFSPSAIRNERRVLRSWYAVLKNRIYFCLVNGITHHSISQIIDRCREFVEQFRHDMEWAVKAGHLTHLDRKQFSLDVDRAWEDGLRRGLAKQRRLMSAERLATFPPAFKMFLPPSTIRNKSAFCLLSQDYPPSVVGGVGRYIYWLARGLADLGHQVHVISRGEGHNRVDLENGVWVHRVAISDSNEEAMTGSGPVPRHIWSYCVSVSQELDRIQEKRRIKCVYAPIWDCEGAAILRRCQAPLVVGLQTPLHFYLTSNPSLRENKSFMNDFGYPMLNLEAEMLSQATAVHSISHAIADDIEAAYKITLRDRMEVIPLGLDDYSELSVKEPDALPNTNLRLLFVGRHEMRKGIDVLLDIIPLLIEEFPSVQIDLVGNDNLPADKSHTFKELFNLRVSDKVRQRVVFHGEVSEEALRGFYKACDVFVAPSRYESFGLVFLEAMMFGKPVVGTRVGGIPEVIVDEKTGLLAKAGDRESLLACLKRLLGDPGLQKRLGKAGRNRYEQSFSVAPLAASIADLMTRAGHNAGASRS